MRQRKAAQIVGWLLMVSAVLLLLSYFGVVDKPLALPPDPETITNETKSSEEEELAKTEINGGSTEPDQTLFTEESLADIDLDQDNSNLEDLVFSNINPDIITTDGMSLRIWPEASSLPEIGLKERNVLTNASPGQPLAGALIIIDPGHGGSDIGVSWQGESEEEILLEKTLNLAVAVKVQEELVKYGAKVYMTRASDEKHSYFYIMALTADLLLQRYSQDVRLAGYNPEPIEPLRLLMQDIIRINSGTQDSGGRGIFNSIGTPPNLKLIYDIQAQYQDTIFISIHQEYSDNSGEKGIKIRYMSKEYIHDMNNSYAAGTEALTHAPNYNAYDSVQRERFANLLEQNLIAQDERLISGRVAVLEDDLAVLRLNNLTSVQLSCGYLSNAEDRARLSSTEGQTKIAHGIANALLQYFSALP